MDDSPPVASSGSRHSCAPAASTTSRGRRSDACTRGCAARVRSGCPSPCTPRARRSPPVRARARAEGRTAMRDFAASRPAVANTRRSRGRSCSRRRVGCSLHVVHVSTGRGVCLVADARARGVDVSCETCPHYLVLTEQDAEALGNVAKCAPPLRPRSESEALWRALADGTLPMVASDDSAGAVGDEGRRRRFRCLGRHLRLSDDAAAAAQRGLRGARAALARSQPTSATLPAGSASPARRLEPGADADLVLVDLTATKPLRPRTFTTAIATARSSAGPTPASRARCVRGRTVFADGRIVGPPAGRLLIPSIEMESP